MVAISLLLFSLQSFVVSQTDAGVRAADAEPTPLEVDTVRIVGTYEPPPKERGMSKRIFLGLRTDGTFFERFRPPCPRKRGRRSAGTCKSDDGRRGTWKLVHREPNRFLQLNRGPLIRYEIDDAAIRLRAPTSRAWETLVRTESPRCLSVDDCGYLRIMHPACAGAWSCVKHECHYVCGQRESIDPLLR